jgi:hypothetical protein
MCDLNSFLGARLILEVTPYSTSIPSPSSHGPLTPWTNGRALCVTPQETSRRPLCVVWEIFLSICGFGLRIRGKNRKAERKRGNQRRGGKRRRRRTGKGKGVRMRKSKLETLGTGRLRGGKEKNKGPRIKEGREREPGLFGMRADNEQDPCSG